MGSNGGGGCVCLRSRLKYEAQKQHKKKGKRRMGIKVLSSNQISSLASAVSAGRPPLLPLPPFSPPPTGFLYPSLSGILSLSLSLCVSPPPLRASCRGCWFAPPCLGLSESCERLLFRSVTADREQLTQGQGESRESESRSAQLSSAQPGRTQICIPAEREKGETPALAGKDSRDREAQSDSER